MASAKVTSKGQITIPVDVRHRLGLQPGSRVAFVLTEAGGYELHAASGSVRDVKGSVPAPSKPVSLAEMDEAIASGATASAS